MIAIVDYGAGNLHSVQKAIEFVGGHALVTNDAKKILQAEKIVLPGVGAFKDGMDGLQANHLVEVLKEFAATGKPFLGICLGMQLLFDEGHEHGIHVGLGFLAGRVLEFKSETLTIPQIGWNTIRLIKKSPLTADLPDESYVYFNHSYYCAPADLSQMLAVTDYEIEFASIVNDNNIYGVQFHPEKSQKVGLQILKNFVEKV
ncbi:MAG: imidazole glycerol phosphate synthase subunit HisH [Anaerolineales bacterium]|nr:imidazole glycerol phosphate synthase subunit HisH [Anaerolineales bacterium]